jgi:A/G-specific adenine glycosylase
MNGHFPTTYAGVRALKGVGDYTAAAICSIAYNMPYAVVDGNVYRVLARYFGIDVPIDSTQGKKLFAALAGEMLDPLRPALYNQAIMDFGALQCTPQSPGCLACPLAESCAAFREGRTGQLPVKQHKTQTRNRYFNYIYVRAREEEGDFTFLHHRTADDIWRNLYELPLIETDAPLTEAEFGALLRARQLFSETALATLHTVRRGVKHILTHRVIYADFYQIDCTEPAAALADCIRVRTDELQQYALPRLIDAFLER